VRKPIDQWLDLNKKLHLHQTLNLVAGGTVALLILAIVIMAFQSPLVVVVDTNGKHYVQSERKADSFSEKDVENFVRDFLVQAFEWKKLAPDVIVRQVSPFSTSGFVERLRDDLTRRAEKDFKGKNLSQAVANIHVQVTDKNVIATFDKVLRIDGFPLVVPSEVALSIIRGSSSKWNPMGLLVNGLVEHEGFKN
jgi:hypothetical protein